MVAQKQLRDELVFEGTATAAALESGILIVDADAEAAAAHGAMLADLGYEWRQVGSGPEALACIEEDVSIGIILVDLDLAGLDGFSLIDEINTRFLRFRPIAVIATTADASLDRAVRAIRHDVVDFFAKPVSPDAIVAGIRRAMHRLADRASAMSHSQIARIGDQLARITAALDGGAPLVAGQPKPTAEQLRDRLRMIIGGRRTRGRFFPSDLFADPAWDILLDLTMARMDNNQVSVSSVCIAASVPMSTALRWVRQMTDVGLLHRWTDPRDKRRDLVDLTDETMGKMLQYLGSLAFAPLKP